MRRHKSREVILQARVQFYHTDRQPNGSYYREEVSKPDVPREELEQAARRVIESELPSELHQIYGLETQTRVIAIRDGSLLVFFNVLVTGIGIFANYADFFESIALVKKHAGMLLKLAMRRMVSLETDVNISTEFPNMPDPDDMYWPRRLRRKMGPFAEELLSSGLPWTAGPTSPRRDGFFWWLLITNLILLTFVGILVAGAVKQTYFSDNNVLIRQDASLLTTKPAPIVPSRTR